MKVTEYVNKTYADLCARLGDAVQRRKKLDKFIDNIHKEIEILDKHSKAIQTAEEQNGAANADGTEKPKSVGNRVPASHNS